MIPAVSRRWFLTAVAAGVTAALAPALPGRSAARLPGDLAYAAMTHDATNITVPMNGTMIMWQQMLRDFEKTEAIAARFNVSLEAIELVLDAETP